VLDFRLSIQLYTVRSETEKDFFVACRALRAIGFRWVELAGFGGFSAAELRERLAEIGLGISGAHVGPQGFEDAGRTIEEHLPLGCDDVTVAWIPQQYRDSSDAWLRTADLMEAASAEYRAEGLRLGYHNHDFEFEEFGGKSGWSILFDRAPTVCAQIDAYWVRKAGADVLECLAAVAGRSPSLHAKDLGADGADIEFGEGVIDWKPLLEAAQAAGVTTLVAELDTPRLPPIESAEACFKGLTAQLGCRE
jgi:sugar phosphate isomerase/epimerase